MAGPQAERAADMIAAHWRNGDVMAELPADLKPTTRAEGYAIQAHLARPGQVCAGWKIAASNAAGQAHIGVDGPLAGRIFADRIAAPGATISLARNRMRVAEPEFAFRFTRGIEPRVVPYSVDEVMAAVGDLHLALELPDSRFADFAAVGGPTLIADNACAHWLVMGAPVTANWRSVDLSQHTVTGHVAGRIERQGSGANVLGDPRIALTWAVNELSGLGIEIRANTFITTGTTMVPLEITEGDDVMADFGALGQVQVFIGP